jgi:hypothetical protein
VLECWSVGVLECWSVGVLEWSDRVIVIAQPLLHLLHYLLHYSITPSLRHPLLHPVLSRPGYSITPLLHYSITPASHWYSVLYRARRHPLVLRSLSRSLRSLRERMTRVPGIRRMGEKRLGGRLERGARGRVFNVLPAGKDQMPFAPRFSLQTVGPDQRRGRPNPPRRVRRARDWRDAKASAAPQQHKYQQQDQAAFHGGRGSAGKRAINT